MAKCGSRRTILAYAYGTGSCCQRVRLSGEPIAEISGPDMLWVQAGTLDNSEVDKDRCPVNVAGNVRNGSWLCKNAHAEPDRIVSVSRFGSGAPFGGFCQCRGYVELFRDLMGGLRRCRRPRALGKGQYLGPHGCHQRAGAENVDQAREVISQDVQRHFGSDSRECLHQEVSCAHPRLDRAEGVLHRLAPLAHPLRVLVEPPLDRLKNILMLPAGDPPFPARGAAVPDGTVQTCVGPVTP